MNRTFLIIVSTLSISLCGSVLADYRRVDEGVKEAGDLSPYQPLGIHAGGFTVFPKMGINNEYDSNIFRRDSRLGTTDSYVAHFNPGVAIKSDWSRHALNFAFDSDLAEYASSPDQANYQDIFTNVGGRLDVLRDSYMDAAFAYNSVHEDRGSPDQIFGKGPTFYDTKDMQWFYTHRFNRASLTGGVDAIRFDYENLLTSTNNLLLMNTRNHWEYMPSIRLGYEIQPGYEAFVKFIYKDVDYDTLVRFGGFGTPFQRDSTGYNALGGMAFDLTDLITGDISVGYLQREFNDPSLKNISGINGFVGLKWRPTALTTVLANFSRDIYETTQFGVSGILVSAISINVEHELLRNVILKAGGSSSQNEYQGFDPTTPILQNRQDRRDDIFGGNLGVKYLINRSLYTDLSYRYQSRDVNHQLSNYEISEIRLNLVGQF